MSVLTRVLSKELQKKSEDELNENPKRIVEDLEIVKKWLDQTGLNAKKEDQWLLTFLRGCKFSHKKVKEKLALFYTFRTTLPEFFSNRDPFLPEIQEILKLGIFLPLASTATPDGPKVIYCRCEGVDATKIQFTTVIKTSLMIVDILLNEDDNFAIGGQDVFFDLKGLNLYHVVNVTPTICQKLIRCLYDGYPTRPKGFHMLNAPRVFQNIHAIVKQLVNDKINKRILFYSNENINDIYKRIPREILPQEYGGGGESLAELTDYWKKKVEDYKDWFLNDANFFSTKSDHLNLVDAFNSFRKLDID